MFALVDCNNFYASCERVFRPDLNHKPIAILSNNDGCVIARSNEAKALGIPMGAPAFKYEQEFKAKGIHVFSSNYPLYGDMSRRVMNLLKTYTPDVEVYSIDEAFLKFEGFKQQYDLRTYGEEIRYKVSKGTGIPVSIGIAPTKALAKVANRIAKKFPKETKGCYVMDTDELRIKALKWLSIEDVWGIGRKQRVKLEKEGVKKAYDFTQLPDDWVSRNLSVVGLRLKRELEGVSVLSLEEIVPKRNIATTRSFDYDYTDYKYIEERIATFASSCGEKLRRQKSSCNAVLVFLRTNRHKEEFKQSSESMVIQLPFSSNSTIDLVKAATKAFSLIYKKDYHYKKAGVMALDVVPENPHQTVLFEDRNPKHTQLMHVMDRINNSVGDYKVKFAIQDLQKTWKMRQERLSPRYTTRLSEVIEVRL